MKDKTKFWLPTFRQFIQIFWQLIFNGQFVRLNQYNSTFNQSRLEVCVESFHNLELLLQRWFNKNLQIVELTSYLQQRWIITVYANMVLIKHWIGWNWMGLNMRLPSMTLKLRACASQKQTVSNRVTNCKSSKCASMPLAFLRRSADD